MLFVEQINSKITNNHFKETTDLNTFKEKNLVINLQIINK